MPNKKKPAIRINVRPGNNLLEVGTGTEGVGCLIDFGIMEDGSLRIEVFRKCRVFVMTEDSAGETHFIK